MSIATSGTVLVARDSRILGFSRSHSRSEILRALRARVLDEREQELENEPDAVRAGRLRRELDARLVPSSPPGPGIAGPERTEPAGRKCGTKSDIVSVSAVPGEMMMMTMMILTESIQEKRGTSDGV